MYVCGQNYIIFAMNNTQIMDILESARMYAILHSSTIEGIDVYAQKYANFFKKISSQEYDPLDHRKLYFDTDYEEYKKSVTETDVELRTFFRNCVALVPNITLALQLIDRYDIFTKYLFNHI